MALPYRPVDVTLAVDDVRSAELVTDVYRAHDDAVEHFGREHIPNGIDKGKHDTPVAFTAVAVVDFSRIIATLGRAPEPDDVRVVWSSGFAEAPKLVAGRNQLFSAVPFGFFLTWRIADRRAGAFQQVMLTPTWSGSGLPLASMVLTSWNSQDGAIMLAAGAHVDPDTGQAAPHQELIDLHRLTIGINLLLVR